MKINLDLIMAIVIVSLVVIIPLVMLIATYKP